jgi:hypothetical protein
MVAVVHYAIRILESSTGREALQRLGIMLCRAWIEDDAFTQEETAPVTRDMKILVNHFLSKIRSGFFSIMIMGLEHMDAEACHLRIPAGKIDQAYIGWDTFDPSVYEPRTMSQICFDLRGVSLTLEAGDCL